MLCTAGENHNLSWNCGEEGPTSNARTERLRQRQLRNFASSLLVAQGVPMILMGDEYGHSKGGNNNTYCHDTALNYVDWAATDADERGLRRFWHHMIRLRKTWPELAQAHFLYVPALRSFVCLRRIWSQQYIVFGVSHPNK